MSLLEPWTIFAWILLGNLQHVKPGGGTDPHAVIDWLQYSYASLTGEWTVGWLFSVVHILIFIVFVLMCVSRCMCILYVREMNTGLQWATCTLVDGAWGGPGSGRPWGPWHLKAALQVGLKTDRLYYKFCKKLLSDSFISVTLLRIAWNLKCKLKKNSK